MWAVSGKKLSGTAQLRGDLENNFDKEISKGVFYGMVNTDMLTNAKFGANLTMPPTEATASIENAKWYAIADDSTETEKPTSIKVVNLFQLNNVNETLEVFDLNGKLLGIVKNVVRNSDLRAVLRTAGYNAGMFLVRDKNTHRMVRVNVR